MDADAERKPVPEPDGLVGMTEGAGHPGNAEGAA